MPFAENLGTGGGSLDAQYGSSPTANTNAPLLLDPRTSGNFVYTPGSAGNYVAVPHSPSLNILGTEGTPFLSLPGPGFLTQHTETPDQPALDITGDIDVRVDLAADDWSEDSALLSKFGSIGNHSWTFRKVSTGALRFGWSTNGTNFLNATSTSLVPFADGQRGSVRATLDVDNAGQYQVSFFTSTDFVNWTPLGSVVNGTTGPTSIFNGDRPVRVGADISAANTGGKFYRAQIRNGINGTVVFDADFTQQALGSRGFIESTGKLVSLVGNAAQIVDGTTYGFLPGVAGSYWSAPDSAALDIAGDIDIKVWLSMNDWTPAAISTPVGKWNGATPSYYFRINTNGTLTFVWVDSGGTTQQLTSTVSVGLADGSSKWIRGTLDVNNGAGQAAAKFYTSDDGTTWTQLGTTVTGTFGTSSIRVGTASLSIGLRDGDQVVSGRVFRVIIQSAFDTADNVASKVFDADFTRQLQFASTFTEGSSQLATVTTVGAARIERDRNLEVVLRVAADDWTPAAQSTLIAKDDGAARQYRLFLNTSGTLALVWYPTGASASATVATSSVGTGAADGSTLWVKVTLDVFATTANVVTFYTAPDSLTEPLVWTQLGTAITTTGATSFAPSTPPLAVGMYSDGATGPLAGKVHVAIIRNGINGPAVLDIDFTDAITTGAEIYLPDTVTEVIPEAEQYLPNLGWGGTALNARFGSAVGADTNDPLLLTHTGENYLYAAGGASTNLVTIPDSPALDVLGDVDFRCEVALDTYRPSAITSLFLRGTADPNRYIFTEITTTGTIRLTWYVLGTNASGLVRESTAAIPYLGGERTWIRFVLDVDNGAGGHDAIFYISQDGSTWVQLGNVVRTAGTTSLPNVTADMRVWGNTAAGKIYRCQMLNGINGPAVYDVNFTTGITSGAQTTFTESSSNAATVTINRNLSGRKSVAVVQDVLLFGTDDYLEVPDNDLLDFGATDSFTVVAAVRQWATQPNFGRFLDKRQASDFAGYNMAGLATTLGRQYMTIDDGPGSTDTSSGAGSTFSAGQFVTVAGVRDTSADIIQSFNNGIATGPPVIDTTTGSLTSSAVLRIAAAATSGGFNDMEFRGSAIWRRALTAAELALVNTHYATGPTAASTALMEQAVWWIDAGTRSVAQINRSTSGRKSVACARCTWLLGTDDYFEVPASNLFNFAQGQDYTLLVLHRAWWAQGPDDTLLATASSSINSSAGWSVTNWPIDPWSNAGKHGDGSNGVTAVGPRRSVGSLTATWVVRDCDNDTLTAIRDATSGTPVTDTTTGTIGNTNVMRLGRLSTTGTEYLDAEVVAAVVWRRALTTAERNAVLAYYGV